MTPHRIALGGALATAVAYGPARMGYGLFLPEFRAAFGLGAAAAGAVASAAFAAFLLALPASVALSARAGPRAPVLVGLGLALAGLALVAASTAVAPFVAGIVIAAASAGLCWTPFNDAVARSLPEARRPTALSIVSTGTTGGVALAGLTALAAALWGLHWRWAWGAFAGAAALAGLFNLVALRGLEPPAARASPPLRGLLRREAAPLYLSAASFGAASAVYLSFAGDRIAEAGGLSGASPSISGPVVFVAYGLGGLSGLAAGWLEARLGLAPLLRAIFVAMAASLALIALAPGSWAGVLASALTQGACVMTFSAVASFWALRLHPGLPVAGFTAAVMALALGAVAGPAAAGTAIDALSWEAAFLGAAALALAPLPILWTRLAGRRTVAS